jgi:DNA polymerase III gamma/tau subunit
VNDFIEAIVDSDIQKGFTTIRSAAGQNLDIKTYLKLILQKMRFALLLRFAPAMEEISEDMTPTDLDFLKALVKKDKGMISSKTLLVILESYESIDRAFIKELPLELALIKILNKDQS